ncbi:unnamed protein product [Closterium sp. Naga37s-1]|nr:unnamed protein product [Closterium sp. Naga37s-1]
MGSWGSYRSPFPRPVLRHSLVPCFGIASSRASALPRPVLRHCLVPCFGIASSRAAALPRPVLRHCLVPCFGIASASQSGSVCYASRHGTTCGWASQRLPCLTVSTHTLPPPFRPLPPPFRPLPPPFRPLPPPFRPLPPPFRPLPPPFRPLPPPFRPLPPPFRPLPPPFRPLPLPSALFPSPLPQRFTEWEYLWVGLAAALPCVLVPPFMLCAADKGRPWHEQHWVKANVWIAVFSFVGNYFWTHYFYTLLGASYTFPSWRLNDVPFALYLLTHAYFCFYHVISNITIRRLRHFLNTPSSTPQPASAKHFVNSKSSSAKSKPSTSSASSASRSSVFALIVQGAWVLALSYITAFMETATIANFEYYTFVDKAAMYRVGTLFYALYFVVSFPFFFRIDEDTSDSWPLSRVAVDSLGASMLVTILLDIWRLVIGPITQLPQTNTCASGLPWMG